MSNLLRLSLICLFVHAAGMPLQAFGVTAFERSIDRDVPLTKTLPIYLQHRLGKVSIQGWVQDRVRVTLKERVFANTEAEAEAAFQKLDLATLATLKQFEIRVGHVQGSDLVSKMKDRNDNSVQVDLEIKAPFLSDLTVVLGEGKSFSLDSWHGGFTLTGAKNIVRLSKLTMNRPLSIHCLECDTEIRDSKMGGHLLLGSKGLLLSSVELQPSLSVESASEEVRVENSKGNLSVQSKTGRLSVAKFAGNIQFQSGEGGADVSGLKGNIGVQTTSGQVLVDIDSLSREMSLDTERGDIQVSLPPSFEGNLDLMSLRGEVVVQFPYEQRKANHENEYGPVSPGRVEGTVGGNHNVTLHAYSKQGGVRILRKVPGK